MADEGIGGDRFALRIGPSEIKRISEVVGVAAVFAPLALALRALVVSHFDYSVAETLVTSTGSGAFLGVALVGIVPGFSYGIALIIAYLTARKRSEYRILTAVMLILLMTPQVLASTILLATIEIITVVLVYTAGW